MFFHKKKEINETRNRNPMFAINGLKRNHKDFFSQYNEVSYADLKLISTPSNNNII